MVDLGCQVTDWVGRNDKEVLDAFLLWDGLILATLSMGKGKCGYHECISGWFGALRGAPFSQMVDLGCQDTDWVGGNDKELLDAILLKDGLIVATLSLDKGKWLFCVHFWLVWGHEGGPPGSHRVDLDIRIQIG